MHRLAVLIDNKLYLVLSLLHPDVALQPSLLAGFRPASIEAIKTHSEGMLARACVYQFV